VIVEIGAATPDEQEWAALLMSRSEPWMRLGRGLPLCRQAFQRPEHASYVARIDGRPVGFVIVHARGLAGSPYIPSIGVDDHHRGRGVGAALIAHVESLFRADARHLFLCVSSFNPRARAFYEREGFRGVGELPDYIIDGASEILMHKRIDRR
jgi:ribosomal-protein-alanine N-acetyltransferase